MATPPPAPIPVLVSRARAAAAAAGFPHSSTDAVGRLLAALAAAKPAGRTGRWRQSDQRGARPRRSKTAAGIFAGDNRIRILTGDWLLLEPHMPFDLFFCDGGGKRDAQDRVIELLAGGGVLVLDDFTPSIGWPPTYQGQVDQLRVRYLTDPRLLAAEVQVSPQRHGDRRHPTREARPTGRLPLRFPREDVAGLRPHVLCSGRSTMPRRACPSNSGTCSASVEPARAGDGW